MSNFRFGKGDRVTYVGHTASTYVNEKLLNKSGTVVFHESDSNVLVDWDDGEERAGVLPHNLATFRTRQPADKLQQLLGEVRKARAAEHAARQTVATIKGQVKAVEAEYNEAQRARQKAVDKLLSAIDEESRA